LLIEIRPSSHHKSTRSNERIIPNCQRRPEAAAGGFDETLAGVGAVDVTRVAEFVIFEDFGVVVEMIGKVEVVVIP
jgi:hypothetical protein